MSRRGILVAVGAVGAGLGAGLVTGLSGAASASASPGATGPGATALRTRTRAQRHKAQPDAVFEVATDKRLVALSFDDGPDPAYTPAVLRLLHDAGAKATFFLVGVNALAYRDLVAAELAAGHTIGNHTYDHKQLELLTASEVAGELERAADALVAAGAPPPTMFRPPYGFTDQAVAVEARRDRYRTVFWTLCLEHFVLPDGVVAGTAAMLDQVSAGAVLLAHDGGTIVGSSHTVDRRPTMEALPLLLAGLKEKGLRVVDVPTLLHHAKAHS